MLIQFLDLILLVFVSFGGSYLHLFLILIWQCTEQDQRVEGQYRICIPGPADISWYLYYIFHGGFVTINVRIL